MKQLMKQIEVRPMRSWLGACSLGLILSLSQMGVAQQTAAPAKAFTPVAFSALAPGASQAAAKPAGEEEEETAKPQKPGHEGLKVHGHWKIVAKNPDGTVAREVEFENSLQIGGGDATLGQLLTGQSTIAEWAIGFNGDTGLCSVECFIAPVAAASDTLYAYCTAEVAWVCFGGLTTVYHPNVASSTPPYMTPVSLVLTSNFTAASAGDIVSVLTAPYVCTSYTDYVNDSKGTPYTPALSPVSAATCLTASTTVGVPALELLVFPPFTTTYLPTPFQFSAGQLVQVSVTISFS